MVRPELTTDEFLATAATLEGPVPNHEASVIFFNSSLIIQKSDVVVYKGAHFAYISILQKKSLPATINIAVKH